MLESQRNELAISQARLHRATFMRTKDGYFLSISASTPKMAARLFDTIGHGEMNEDRRFNTNEGRLKHRDIVDQTVAEWIANATKMRF